MKKIIYPYPFLLPILILSGMFFWSSCASDGQSGSVGSSDAGPEPSSVVWPVDQAKLDALKADLAKIPAEQGGQGFEQVAEKDGWKTKTDFEFYGDPDAKKGGSITFDLQEFPTTYRSIGKDARFQVISIITGLMYETLLGLDGKTMEHIPALATHWRISEDKTTYEFRLDPRAHWWDGMPLVADDVIASYKLHADKGIEDPNVYTTYTEEFNVPEKVSPYIVRVKVKKKTWTTFNSFGLFLKIFPNHYLEKLGGGKDYLEKYQYQIFPGTGPYELDLQQTKNGELLVMKRRADYWAENDPANKGINNFNEIRFTFTLDDKLALERFKKGDYDIYQISRAQWWVEEFDVEKTDHLKRGIMQKNKIFNFNPKGTSGLAFNTAEKPFDDMRVRQAIAMLWNFDQLNEKLFFKEYEKCVSYYQGSIYQNPNNPQPKYDPEGAIKLLNEAGWVKKEGDKWLTKDGKPLEFDLEIFQSLERIFTPLQQDLEKAGIKMNLSNITPQAKFEKVMKKQFKVTQQNWTGTTFPNPEGMLHSKYAQQLENSNITRMANKHIDELCDKYESSYEVADRIKIIKEIDSLACAENHYAFGWVAPYTSRVVYWNKFRHPKCGLTRTGDFEGIMQLWWYDADKASKVKQGKDDTGVTIPSEEIDIDCWGRKQGAKSVM